MSIEEELVKVLEKIASEEAGSVSVPARAEALSIRSTGDKTAIWLVYLHKGKSASTPFIEIEESVSVMVKNKTVEYDYIAEHRAAQITVSSPRKIKWSRRGGTIWIEVE